MLITTTTRMSSRKLTPLSVCEPGVFRLGRLRVEPTLTGTENRFSCLDLQLTDAEACNSAAVSYNTLPNTAFQTTSQHIPQ